MITANDYRKYLDAKEPNVQEVKAPAPLLEQVASPDASTGDDRLDKMVRAIQAIIEVLEKQLPEIAAKGMGAVPVDMMKLCQMDYMHTHGKLIALQEIIKLPAQIMMEEKTVLHSV